MKDKLLRYTLRISYDIVLPPTGIQGTAAPLAAVFMILCGAGTGYLIFFRQRKSFR